MIVGDKIEVPHNQKNCFFYLKSWNIINLTPITDAFALYNRASAEQTHIGQKLCTWLSFLYGFVECLTETKNIYIVLRNMVDMCLLYITKTEILAIWTKRQKHLLRYQINISQDTKTDQSDGKYEVARSNTECETLCDIEPSLQKGIHYQNH